MSINIKKILFIGAVNENHHPEGGEEFRNQIFTQYLSAKFKLKVIDTVKWTQNPLTLINILFSLYFLSFDKIILSASSLSSYRFLKFVFFFLPHLKNKIIYSVIGGFFPAALDRGIYNKKYFEGIYKIIVQGEMFKISLLKNGLHENVMVIPNYKNVSRVWNSRVSSKNSNFRFVFLSTIMPDKGVVTIFEAISILSNKKLITDFSVDFYGPIEKNFKDEFNRLLNFYVDFCKYCGYIDIMNSPEVSYQVLSEYDVMLFPTVYIGEGFPGVILDAYIAGLPVIATDWNMNSELVQNRKTGIIIPPNDSIELAQAMSWMIRNRDLVHIMKQNCNILSYKYDINFVLDKNLIDIL